MVCKVRAGSESQIGSGGPEVPESVGSGRFGRYRGSRRFRTYWCYYLSSLRHPLDEEVEDAFEIDLKLNWPLFLSIVLTGVTSIMSGNFPENKELYRAGALEQIHYMSVMKMSFTWMKITRIARISWGKARLIQDLNRRSLWHVWHNTTGYCRIKTFVFRARRCPGWTGQSG